MGIYYNKEIILSYYLGSGSGYDLEIEYRAGT